ncbi:MAG: asparagine synthase (glutamine-hydrolyzing) [Acetobacteraceae bacterium]|nr:asparagine synthase (glutamine-hydrolyzing) [Acetobacteraceae bacterium]
MCGLAGVMTRDGAAPDPAMLDRLLAALAHRGPDGQGRLVRGGVALLHARLAIVDLATGDQPLFAGTEPGTGTALVCNGEIYNNPALRAAMPATRFRTRSDCEPALWRYMEDGARFADALRGMYAIAIHDPDQGRLVLARDPFGIKQLYYIADDRGFFFASEPQALIAAGLAAPGIDARARAELLQLKFTTGAATIFPGITRLLPGETLVVERGAIVARHHRAALPEGPPRPLGNDGVAALDRVLLDSVTAHLQSDVPYGLFLSGGIDSAAVLALMHRATGQRIHALTCGWDGVGVDETGEAARLAAAQGAVCERVAMGEADFWALAPRIAAAIDDPTADAAVLPTWMLGRAARAAGLKVTLCGEGADELFGGYARYRKQRSPWRWFTRPPRSRAVLGEVPALAGWRDGIAGLDHRLGAGRSAVQAAQAVDIAEWLPNDLLVKLDRCLMAHGVEGRTPFLDPAVAGFAFTLPDAAKVDLRFGKKLLRRWLAGAFPQAGAFARKKGFKPPVGAWIAARAESLAPLLAAQPGIAAVLGRAEVAARLARAEAAPQPAWSLLFYGLWHCRHAMGLDPSGDVHGVLRAAQQSSR